MQSIQKKLGKIKPNKKKKGIATDQKRTKSKQHLTQIKIDVKYISQIKIILK
jgi:hypothetical protein